MELRSKVLSLLYPLKRYLDRLFVGHVVHNQRPSLPIETFTQSDYYKIQPEDNKVLVERHVLATLLMGYAIPAWGTQFPGRRPPYLMWCKHFDARGDVLFDQGITPEEYMEAARTADVDYLMDFVANKEWPTSSEQKS